MPRRKLTKKRKIQKDPLYKSLLVAKLINRSMYDGKKSTARKQVYQAFEIVKKKTKIDPLTVFEKALSNIRPRVEVRSRRVGGAAYQIPIPVSQARQNSLSIRWLIILARQKPNKEFHSYGQKLASEIIAAFNQEGGAVGKRQEIERIAESNKAFAHLRW